MSEKLYAFFLRLFPAHFREEYGDEALQLFRDRARDERGFFSRLRLWFDLFFDMTVSLPREYLHLPAPRAVPSPLRRLPGIPAFHVLQDVPVRPGALFFGGILSCVALTTCWAALNQIHRPETPNSSSSARPSYASASGRSGNTASASHRRLSAYGANRSFIPTDPLSDSERKRIITSLADNVKQHYADRVEGQKAADLFLAREKRGEYDDISDRAMLAAVMTDELREATGDRNLTLDYFSSPLPQQPSAQLPEVRAQYRESMKQQNCTFEKVELLPRNIGYLKLNSFPDPEVCRVAAMAAMTYVNHADAVIFDLRENRGGYPAMVQFLGSYLFDHPEYWYNPREATTENSWTRSPIEGNNLTDKPVFILTSKTTASGAEQFAYDLKMLKRATIVGETTAGAAHSGVFHRLDDHFGMGIPEVKAINPYSANDWSEVGVSPDIKVPAANALDAALKLAHAKLSKK
ncbi:MAG: S41 family peptidase [Acidobacteria bacterium]|nr:S41 family peptidase [Acidobacteriota bacterium]MBS1865443.1 S41 family peptidase [Acidobacteriota bacterium]